MARLPDGIIGKFKVSEKGTAIDIETKELILCKHCKYYFTDDVWCDDDNGRQKLVAKNISFCKVNKNASTTNPDGYCHLAKKDE